MADHAVDVPNGLETEDEQVGVVEGWTNRLGSYDEPVKGGDTGTKRWGEGHQAVKMVREGTYKSGKHAKTNEAIQKGTEGLGNYYKPDKAVEQVPNGLENDDEGVIEVKEETVESGNYYKTDEAVQEVTDGMGNYDEPDNAIERGSNVFEKGDEGVNEDKDIGNLLAKDKETAESATEVTHEFVKEEETVEAVQYGTNGMKIYNESVNAVPEETNQNTMIDFTREEIHIKKIEIGSFEIDTTYPAAYPDQLNKHSYVNGHLFACEFCLQFTDSPDNLKRHRTECTWTQPCGGIEVYNKGDMSVFEIDGTREKGYCECLCLISKLFLDNKRKRCIVEDFVFYVLTINDMRGKHLAGYFSKEKSPNGNNNVSCLLILPHYQRQGLGRFLIDLSYLLSRIVKVPGTPERPLSGLGMISYQSYWKNIIAEFLYNHITERSILIRTISEKTGIDPYDIALTLQMMNLVKHRKTKVSIVVKQRVLAEYVEAVKAKNHIILDEECLQWTPWVQENTKEMEKSSRLLRGNAVHNFPIVKNEERYFSHSELNDVKPPPCKIAK